MIVARAKASRRKGTLISEQKRRLKLLKEQEKGRSNGVHIEVPIFDFSKSSEDGACGSSSFHSPGGDMCQPSTSRQKEAAMESDTAVERVPKMTIMTATCKSDVPSLKEAFEAEKLAIKNYTKNEQGLENQMGCALVQAVTSKNVMMVEAILDIMAGESHSLDKWSLLPQYAVTSDCEDIVDIFINRGILSHDYTAALLHQTARIGNTNIMRKLLQLNSNNVSATTSGQSALHVAITYNKNFCARMLIDAGADLAIKDHIGRTPLHEAAARGNDAMVQCLLSEGADPLVADFDGITPWFYSVQYGHRRTAERLTKKMDEEHFKSALPNGKGYLHLVVARGLLSITKDLLNMGCDPVARDQEGNTPLMAAVSGTFTQTSLVSLLLESSAVCAEINALNNAGETALSLALNMYKADFLLSRSKSVINMLLKAGADVDRELGCGKTVLMKYFLDEQKRNFLMENGANLNKVSSNGMTVLWSVCHENYNRSNDLEQLMALNIDIRISQHKYKRTGTTPFIEALSYENTRNAEILYYADCSLNGLKEWLDTHMARDTCNSIKALVRTIDISGHMNSPISLWSNARLATLGTLSHEKAKDKYEKLGLPEMVSCLLDWNNYESLRQLEENSDL